MNLEISRWYGRLGNNIMQLVHVIWLSKLKRAKITYIPHHPILETKHLIQSPMHKGTKTIKSIFFKPQDVHNILGFKKYITIPEIQEILKTEIKFRFPLQLEMPNDNIVIHIRSGDCFRADRPNPHAKYIPPPTSYYRKCIDDHVKKHETSRIIIVTEPDKYNPSIQGIQTYVNEIYPSIDVVVQSTSIENDALTIMKAKHLILSIGYFGYTLALINSQLETLYISNYMMRSKELCDLNICKRYNIDNYIKPGEWNGDTSQIKMLIEHEF